MHSFFDEFHIGVSFFFVLSGFLITYRYYNLSRTNIKKYLVNRFSRIYPMYFILTTATFIVLALKTDNSIDQLKLYFYNITFLKGFFDALKFTGIAQGWTLTVEEMFYFSAPLFFFLIRKKSRYYVVLLPVCLFIIGIALVALFGDGSIHGFFDSLSFMAIYTFFGRASEFFIGVGLAIFYRKYGRDFNYKYSTLTGACIVILCLILLSLMGGGGHMGIDHPLGVIVNNLILPLFGIAVFYWGLITEKTVFRRVLSTRLFDLFGKSSYTFYLIHVGIISSFILQYTSNVIVVFVVLNIVSIILYKIIEVPLTKFFRRSYYHITSKPN